MKKSRHLCIATYVGCGFCPCTEAHVFDSDVFIVPLTATKTVYIASLERFWNWLLNVMSADVAKLFSLGTICGMTATEVVVICIVVVVIGRGVVVCTDVVVIGGWVVVCGGVVVIGGDVVVCTDLVVIEGYVVVCGGVLFIGWDVVICKYVVVIGEGVVVC